MTTYTPEFEVFWKVYPRKVAKLYVFKCWNKLKKSGDLPSAAKLHQAIRDQKKWREMKKAKNEFVPEWKHPSTWLNQGCWMDECELNEPNPLPTKPKKENGIVRQLTLLNGGLDILQNQGKTAFRLFAAQHKMSEDDIQRVEAVGLFTMKGV